MRRPHQPCPIHRRDAAGVARSPASPAPPRPRPSWDGGTAAIEFAFVGPVFIALLFFVTEAAWQLTVNLALHIGVVASSRYTATNADASASARYEAARNRVISASGGVLKPSNLTLFYPQVVTDPAVLATRCPSAAPDGTSGQVGGSAQLVRYCVRYRQDFITPVASLSRMLVGYDAIPPVTHTASLVVQNEPF